jgi:hypothetical protein
MHLSLLNNFNNHPLHVSNRLTIHHQAVRLANMLWLPAIRTRLGLDRT